MRLGRRTEDGESPVGEKRIEKDYIQSTTEHEEFCGKQGGPSPKAKYYLVTDRGEYREGKVKRTPGGEWKEPETLCLQALEVL